MKDIQNIIFDLGGVIIGLDLNKTYTAFETLFGEKGYVLLKPEAFENIFYPFETGAISADEFRNRIRQFTGITVSDDSIDNAWNEMIGDIPQAHFDLLNQLKPQFNTYLFSNTNAINYNYLSNYLIDNNFSNLSGYFKKAYYSHLLGLRKPNASAFQAILNENNLNPKETLFLDDTAEHLRGAESIGIKTKLVTSDNDILTIFKDYVNI